MAKCKKFELDEQMCSHCAPPKQVLNIVKKHTNSNGIKEVGTKYKHISGYAIVRPSKFSDPNKTTFSTLNSGVKIIHIDGALSTPTLKLILERAPNVEKIQVIPAIYTTVPAKCFKLCAKKGIEVVEGYHRESGRWCIEERPAIARNYAKGKKIIDTLNEGQRRLLRECIGLGIIAAVVTAEYFCFEEFGGSRKSQRELSIKYGYKNNALVNTDISAFLLLLQPDFKNTKKAAVEKANVLRKKLKRLLHFKNMRESLEKCMAQRDLELLPTNLPPAKTNIYRTLVDAYKEGRWTYLDDRIFCVLTKSFGLGDGVCLRQQDIANQLGYCANSIISILIQQGLKKLKI